MRTMIYERGTRLFDRVAELRCQHEEYKAIEERIDHSNLPS
jgi:hypothetical protein